MFVVLTYDISGPHIQKVLKICRRYLIHVQNSVFEGTIVALAGFHEQILLLLAL